MEKRIVIFIIFLFTLFLIRLFVFYSFRTDYKEGEQVTFESRIVSDPRIYKSYQSFSVLLPNQEPLFVKTVIFPEYSYQDKISVSGSIKYQLLNNKKRF